MKNPMQIQVVKEVAFEAAHCLPQHPGKCKTIHGHRYVLQIGFVGPVNSENGMVLDFDTIDRAIMRPILLGLDHQFLNQVTQLGFPRDQPTAENMVRWLVDKVISASGLSFVRLYETPTSYAEWRREEPNHEGRATSG